MTRIYDRNRVIAGISVFKAILEITQGLDGGMATSQDKGNRSKPSGVMQYVLIGLTLSPMITWNRAVVIAELYRLLLSKPLDDEKRIVEVALVVTVVSAFIGVLLGRWGAKRG